MTLDVLCGGHHYGPLRPRQALLPTAHTHTGQMPNDGGGCRSGLHKLELHGASKISNVEGEKFMSHSVRMAVLDVNTILLLLIFCHHHFHIRLLPISADYRF